MAFACVLSLGFTSCGDDDDDSAPAPTIVMDEANIEDGEICVKADVNAPGRTAAIKITVTDAQGNNVKVTKNVTDAKYIGVLNIDGFHVHVDIDNKGVVVGDLLKLTVTDTNGKSTTAQKSITEEEDDDRKDHQQCAGIDRRCEIQRQRCGPLDEIAEAVLDEVAVRLGIGLQGQQGQGQTEQQKECECFSDSFHVPVHPFACFYHKLNSV